jgi:hypothetical protein
MRQFADWQIEGLIFSLRFTVFFADTSANLQILAQNALTCSQILGGFAMKGLKRG